MARRAVGAGSVCRPVEAIDALRATVMLPLKGIIHYDDEAMKVFGV